MSATEQMRAMLDGLMGTARDGSDSQRQHLHFTDPRVCRAFLLDCCPHDIFASTKLELGECSKTHDPALRADYIIAKKTEDFLYEKSALERLQSFVNEADKKTEYLKRKLAETQEELTAEETSKLNSVHELTEKLGKKLAQVEKAELDGDLEAKQKYLDESEKIKKERATAETEYKKVSRPVSSHQQQNLRVCDICSAYLGINDNDNRLADHFGGKLHLGFITVREKLEDLKKIVAEKRASSKRNPGSGGSHRNELSSSNRDRGHDRSNDYDRNHRDYDRDYDHKRSRDYDPYRDRDYDRDRYRDRARDARYHDRELVRDRSRSSSRYYRETSNRDSRPRDHRYRDDRSERIDRMERTDRVDKVERPERNESIFSSKGVRGTNNSYDSAYQEQDITYQRRLRDWEKREAAKAKKYAIRLSDEQERKQLEEQESRKLKEFLEDYKDDRDDARFYYGSALSRRMADRRKEMTIDEAARQKEREDLEILSKSCAAQDNNLKATESLNETSNSKMIDKNELQNHNNGIPTNVQDNNTSTDPNNTANSSSSSLTKQTTTTTATTIAATTTTTNTSQNKSSSSEDKRKQVEELIGSIPTDKDQLFKRNIEWSLLDDTLMEKRMRPWITKKVAEYMGEKEADLIDFVCGQLTSHTDGASLLKEVAVVLDDEAEKFVVHMWRLLIFELEAKKIGLRK